MRYWALRFGREAPPCIRPKGRRGARGEPAGELKWAGRYPGPPPQSNRDGASVQISPPIFASGLTLVIDSIAKAAGKTPAREEFEG